MTKVKICGITNLEDALSAAKYKADFLGFVFAKSQRQVTPLAIKKMIKIIPKRVKKIGVFVNQDYKKINAIVRYCKLDLVQLHGDEPPTILKKIKAKVIKAFRVRSKKDIDMIKKYKNAYAILLDTYIKGKRGGTGKVFDWDIAKEVRKLGFKVFLAGGISPKNVKKAVMLVRPYAIDSSSNVERAPGKKDQKKVKALISAVKKASI